jgi:NOL1/NOP2/sun family putative RNA methylase
VKYLPAAFIKRYRSLLSSESEEFLDSFSEPPIIGLRVNTLKISAGDFVKISPFPLEPVPWSSSGFIIPNGYQPGKHPYHAAGLYYLQEPSAMAVAELLAPEPGERVLELAAAPGGKATQLAALMKNEGILVANDLHPRRVWGLAENLERCGVRNVAILNETPENFIPLFVGFFDRVLLDAPCCGEGMFRRSENARSDWSENLVLSSSLRQYKILQTAAQLVRPGGILVYSTCTFSPEENESVIDKFLISHPEFELTPLPLLPGFSCGRPDWVEGSASPSLQHAIRIWPHKARAEGHFFAVLKKSRTTKRSKTYHAICGMIPQKTYNVFREFCQENLAIQFGQQSITQKGSYIYQVPENLPQLGKLKVIHPGWWLGVFKKNRVEPAHALALGISSQDVLRNYHIISSQATQDLLSKVVLYLRGEQLELDDIHILKNISGERKDTKGWGLVCLDNYPLGWGKLVGNVVKNYYPRGLRWV